MGTFWCFLFGHKRIALDRKQYLKDGIKYENLTFIRINYCSRCGISMTAE